jgi:hypothetical protein
VSADLQRTLPILAVAGFLAVAIGLWIDPRAMLASYLVAWFSVSAIPIGAIGVLFTSYLVRAGWTQDLRTPLTAAALTLPFVGLLFLPVAVGMSWLYPWATGTTALPAFKAAYLAPWFFILRSVVYFAIWTALAGWGALSFGDDAAMTRVASAGLIVWPLTVSFAGIDWLESIEPQFHSSIYGLLAISFYLLAGFAFGLSALLTSRRPHRMSNVSYGGVLLSVLMLWAYLHAMQYIIIWAGNLPEEVIWYTERLAGGWGIALWIMFLGQFIVPFFALLSQRVRSSTRALLALAVATLAFRYVEAAVLILPPLDIRPVALLLGLPATAMATGAAWLIASQHALPMWQQISRRMMPAQQP